MIYEMEVPDGVRSLFGDWEETMIYSCLQRMMGKLYVTDVENPLSAMARLGDFAFLAGEPSRELILGKREGFVILVPQTLAWAELIEQCFPEKARQVTRYAMKKNTLFDRQYLAGLVGGLPEGYELRRIDGELYDQCRASRWSEDFVSVFASKEAYLEYGLGMVILKDGDIVSGASSYTRYRDGIEIEVDTRADERRRHLALTCCAALILECLKRGLYPSWDAQNLWSVHLAEKLGYEFSHEYMAYEVG